MIPLPPNAVVKSSLWNFQPSIAAGSEFRSIAVRPETQSQAFRLAGSNWSSCASRWLVTLPCVVLP